MIYESVLDTIGRTPIVSLGRLGCDVPADIHLKLECLNPGGSHKVRIALNMIHDYERVGILERGSGQTILEPTGGNTGLGIAMAAAVLGYRVVLVIPDNYAHSKRRILEAFGAQIVLSDSERGNNSHGELAACIQEEHPEYVMCNQAFNPANPAIHRSTTAVEILEDFAGARLDVFVAGIGTGGHITGIAEVLRETYPDLRVVGVQPEGCELLEDRFVKHAIQGLAVGMIPPVLNTKIIDEMVSVTEGQAIAAMTELMRVEGIAAGISSGANVAVALRIAEQLPRGSSILTMAYDGAADYVDALGGKVQPPEGQTIAHAPPRAAATPEDRPL